MFPRRARVLPAGLALLLLAGLGQVAAAQQPARPAKASAARAKARAARPVRDPHLHGATVVQGGPLIQLARKEGDLEAGLDALGLSHLPRREALRQARSMMSLANPTFNDTYKSVNRFRSAAFKGPHYVSWVRETLRRASTERPSLVQMTPHEAIRLVKTAREHGIATDGVRLLLGISRERIKDGKTTRRALEAYDEIAGLDVVGPEEGVQNADTLRSAVRLLLDHKPGRSFLRIHAGEGFLGEGGRHNVNRALDTLARMAEKEDLSRVEVIIGHAVHIADLPAAQRDLDTLRARGVDVILNINPVSNLVNRNAEDLSEIDALKLDAEIEVGSDNVLSLKVNRKVGERLLRGDLAGANDLLRHVRPVIQAHEPEFRAARQEQIERGRVFQLAD